MTQKQNKLKDILVHRSSARNWGVSGLILITDVTFNFN